MKVHEEDKMMYLAIQLAKHLFLAFGDLKMYCGASDHSITL